MEHSAEDQRVRRIVTGHNAQGRSVIISDTTAVMEGPLHELWVTDGTPARFGGAPHLGALPVDLEPRKEGTVVRLVRFMPSQALSRDDLEQMYSKGFAAINASHTRVDTRRHPAMHKTRTLDYGIVLSGRIKLLMDEGEQELKPFDVVIQRGTNHGWVNPGSVPALMAFVLIDGTE
jgi:mannose-6-phosphate isomerase-like protein (cupin superfamily)